MNKKRKLAFGLLIVLSFLALPGADIECEDDELEINWPDFDRDDGYFYYHEDVWYEPAPCCWW